MAAEARDLRISASRSAISQVLRDIDLAVERGEFISVVGPSGCGKTTFLRIVAGLEPASTGEVLLDGRAVRGPGGDRGFVFQSDNLLPWRTVFANAIIGPRGRGPRRPGRAAAHHGAARSWSGSKASSTTIRASSPAACASASTSPARSPSIRKSC